MPTQPLKDNSNIRIIKISNSEQVNPTEALQASGLKLQQQQQQHQTQQQAKHTNERPLKCLETLAQKAGITIDEKYDFASPPHPGVTSNGGYSHSYSNGGGSSISTSVATSTTSTTASGAAAANYSNSLSFHKSFTMEKSQSPAQQVTPSTVPLQISPEQLQQLTQLQLQHGSPFAIQVKQEFPTHTTHQLGGTGGPGDLKHTGMLDHTTQSQLQQMQMQLDGGAPGSPANQQTPNSAAAAMQQHSTTISTMSPMQLTTGQVQGDWGQGRTVQLMQPHTAAAINSGIFYPQMLVSGNLIHSTGIGQPPIQVSSDESDAFNAVSIEINYILIHYRFLRLENHFKVVAHK